ncbi:methyl-accepting chemotaxis protein [Noviherbaspirillum agri]
MSFADLKVGTRLTAAFGLVVALLVGITILGVTRLAALDQATALIVSDSYPKVALSNKVLEGISEAAIRMRNLLVIHDPDKVAHELAEIARIRKDVGGYIDDIGKRLYSPKGQAMFREIQEARTQYRVQQDEFLRLIAEGKQEEAAVHLLDNLIHAQQVYFGKVKGLVDLVATIMEQSGADASAQYHSAATLMIGLAALAFALATALALWVTRSITRPLDQAVQVARTVAAGDLTSRIEVKSKDETGQLMHSLKDMNDSLVKIVAQVRGGTGSIAAASSEIAAGNLDLSSRTEEQASSLEETASSMEELTSTVRQNADNARQANQLAASASDVAAKGGAVVSQVVDTMGAINASSSKIVDIIGVIDGIAFQTNILALNAAVEAARAGEQGRGFAVVASEVRSLAQRSAAAAKEIKSLIDDSVHKVHVGTDLVNQAGATMQEIVDSVRRVTDIMAEIAAASAEQTAGIEQVNQAIAQMDEVTQQNASLVEEAAAAAESLNEQAGKLNEVVTLFKLDATAAIPAAQPRPAVATRAAKPALSHAQHAQHAKHAQRAAISPEPMERIVASKPDSSDDWEQF